MKFNFWFSIVSLWQDVKCNSLTPRIGGWKGYKKNREILGLAVGIPLCMSVLFRLEVLEHLLCLA